MAVTEKEVVLLPNAHGGRKACRAVSNPMQCSSAMGIEVSSLQACHNEEGKCAHPPLPPSSLPSLPGREAIENPPSPKQGASSSFLWGRCCQQKCKRGLGRSLQAGSRQIREEKPHASLQDTLLLPNLSISSLVVWHVSFPPPNAWVRVLSDPFLFQVCR